MSASQHQLRFYIQRQEKNGNELLLTLRLPANLRQCHFTQTPEGDLDGVLWTEEPDTVLCAGFTPPSVA